MKYRPGDGKHTETELASGAADVPVQHIQRLLDRMERHDLAEEVKVVLSNSIVCEQ